ncbi:MAG: hypothetical protein VYD57_08465 [Pseudomonadota bacterium]|nr:hypothetical protein [Pseudomonadota bacterium]
MTTDQTDPPPSKLEPAVWLIGNAPVAEDRSRAIDGAEVVVRFNNAFGFGGVTGTRTTHLFLINCGGQAREWLADPNFADRAQAQAAGTILLPIHPAKDDLYRPPLTEAERHEPDAVNMADAMVLMLRGAGKRVGILPPELFLKACRVIGYERPERGMAAPSTGLIALLWALENFDLPIVATGFGFDGWPGHRWVAERAFFEALRGEGRLLIYPLDQG